jgi:hypothetical protein
VYSAVVDYELGIVSRIGIETGLEIESEEVGAVSPVGAGHKIQSASDIASGPDVKCVQLAEYSTSVSQPVLETEPDSGVDTLDYSWSTASHSLPLLSTCFDKLAARQLGGSACGELGCWCRVWNMSKPRLVKKLLSL